MKKNRTRETRLNVKRIERGKELNGKKKEKENGEKKGCSGRKEESF